MGAARADDEQGTPTQSHISPSTVVYEDKRPYFVRLVDPSSLGSAGVCVALEISHTPVQPVLYALPTATAAGRKGNNCQRFQVVSPRSQDQILVLGPESGPAFERASRANRLGFGA